MTPQHLNILLGAFGGILVSGAVGLFWKGYHEVKRYNEIERERMGMWTPEDSAK
jgi:hypothetical protein